MHSGESLAGAAGLTDRQPRLLAWAALGSLALHALIFLVLPALRDAYPARPAPPPLTAQLARPEPPKPSPPEPPRAEPPAPAPRPAARPQPRPAPQAAPILGTAPARPAAEPAVTVPPAPASPATAPPAASTEAPPPAAAASPDPGSLARFRLELMDVARRYKRYPRIAQDNNWEGRVELRVAFTESGSLGALTVKKSAGRTVLDEEAQAMIRSAQPHLTVPAALRGKAFVLEIPVDFSLKD